DKVMEAGLDAGAEDVMKNDDDSVELICAPDDFTAVTAALEKAGLKPELSEITWKPTNETAMPADLQGRMRSLVDALETLDDVQNVYTTAVID
ncbi:MAG: YebC/PmpR family DNA-binding transcriptional regulator, partial [Betaproteobacteria bacterium]|nr:YebC/PmpR family DNA-binding transcriptional regulator [Betaproteobacteria bacterium]MBV9359863.1 YebC/PmpR family DNA-binding transcriptional regulator [Betaproteobacteria bacterium]